MTQRVDDEWRFAYTEDGGNPLYRGGTALEGQGCLSQSSHTRFGWQGREMASMADLQKIIDFWESPDKVKKWDLADTMAMIKHTLSVRSVLVFFLAVIAVIFIALSWQFGVSAPQTNPSDDPVVATIGGRPITLRQV